MFNKENPYCSYCGCDDCINGSYHADHALTENGNWICDICYTYDLCTKDGPDRNKNGPCKDKNCKHRPKLIGPWIPYKNEIGKE